MVGLNAITRKAWNTTQNTEERREKIQALSLAKECYSMKLVDLLTNATVVDDAIRIVAEKSNDKLKLSKVIAMKMIKNQKNLTMMKIKIS